MENKTPTQMIKKIRKPTKNKALNKRAGKAIAKHRLMLGMTQAQVAQALDLEVETISRIETGAVTVTLTRLEYFRKLFKCPIQAFFEDEDQGQEDGQENFEALLKNLAVNLDALKPKGKKVLTHFMTEISKIFKKVLGENIA